MSFDLMNPWGTSPTLDTSTWTPPPAIISNAGDALTQAQTGVSQGWDWANDLLKNTMTAVTQIGVAKYAAKNGVAVTATTPVTSVQDPRTGQLVPAAYSTNVPQQQGSGLMTLALVAGVIWLATRK